MSKVSMTVKQIKELGLLDKVFEYCNINPYALNEGQIDYDDTLEFDTEFKKEEKVLQNKFSGEVFIIRNSYGDFIYGECEGYGKDFELAYKFSDYDEADRFLTHHYGYSPIDGWNIKRVSVTYKIV